MDWILDEVKESIKNQITICESFMEVCEMQLKGYKDQFNTDDKNEACNHSFWKASKIRTAYEVNHLKEILQEIDEMMLEEVKQFEELEDDVRTVKADAQI